MPFRAILRRGEVLTDGFMPAKDKQALKRKETLFVSKTKEGAD
jgi:hypothetical protein